MKLNTIITALALATVAVPAMAHEGGPSAGKVGGGLTDAERTELVQERFAAADANGDGELALEEMIAAAEAVELLRREERIARVIEMMDADDNGTISLEEMQAPHEREGHEMRRGRDGREHH